MFSCGFSVSATCGWESRVDDDVGGLCVQGWCWSDGVGGVSCDGGLLVAGEGVVGDGGASEAVPSHREV